MRNSVCLINKDIKPIKIILAFCCIFISEASIIYTTQPSPIQNVVIAEGIDNKVDSRAEIIAKIHLYSDKYNVPFERVYNTIACETGKTFDTKIQSRVKYNFSAPNRGIVEGTQEMSFGLAQIHLPDHPKISYEQATDVDFAINFMAESYSKGKDLWYCD